MTQLVTGIVVSRVEQHCGLLRVEMEQRMQPKRLCRSDGQETRLAEHDGTFSKTRFRERRSFVEREQERNDGFCGGQRRHLEDPLDRLFSRCWKGAEPMRNGHEEDHDRLTRPALDRRKQGRIGCEATVPVSIAIDLLPRNTKGIALEAMMCSIPICRPSKYRTAASTMRTAVTTSSVLLARTAATSSVCVKRSRS